MAAQPFPGCELALLHLIDSYPDPNEAKRIHWRGGTQSRKRRSTCALQCASAGSMFFRCREASRSAVVFHRFPLCARVGWVHHNFDFSLAGARSTNAHVNSLADLNARRIAVSNAGSLGKCPAPSSGVSKRNSFTRRNSRSSAQRPYQLCPAAT